MSQLSSKRVLRLIAFFEGFKGLGAIASAFGLLSLIHHDIRHLVFEIIGHYGIDPTHHYPELVLQYADKIARTPESSILMIAFIYAAIRVSEAVGLWWETAWGEWLAVLSGGFYIPFELEHLIKDYSVITLFICVFNVSIVIFLSMQLYKRKNQ